MTRESRGSVHSSPFLMKKLRKQLFVYFAVLVYVFGPFGVRPAHAALPFAIVAASSLGAAVVAAGGLTHYAPQIYEAGQQAISGTGNFARKVFSGTPILQGTAASAVVGTWGSIAGSFLDMGQYIADHAPSLPTWSSLWGAATTSSNTPPDIGSTVNFTTSTSTTAFPCAVPLVPPVPRKILSVGSTNNLTGSAGNDYSCLPAMVRIGGSTYVHYIYLSTNPNGSHNLQYTIYSTTTTTDPAEDFPPPGGFQPEIFAQNYPYTQAAQDELDDIIAGNPGILYPPVANPVPGDIVANPGAASPTAVPNATQLDQARAESISGYANDVYAPAIDNINNTYNSDVTNVAQQDAALKTLEKAAEAEKAAEDVFNPPAVTGPTPPTIDFSPITSIGSIASGKFPFALPSYISGWIDSFVGTPVTPSLTTRNPFTGSLETYTLSAADDAAAFIRWVIAFCFHVAVVWAIIRKWSS